MSLISLVIVLVLVGILLWAVNTYIPMDTKIKSIINIVVVVAVVIWLLRVFGLFGEMERIRVGANDEFSTEIQAASPFPSLC